MSDARRSPVAQTLVMILTSVAASVIASIVIDAYREKRQGALSKPVVPGFDHT